MFRAARAAGARERLAGLLAHGLIPGSFLPPDPIQEHRVPGEDLQGQDVEQVWNPGYKPQATSSSNTLRLSAAAAAFQNEL